MNILRARAEWAGFTGAPGFTVMHFRGAGGSGGAGSDPTETTALDAVNRIRVFFAAFSEFLPDDVTINLDPVVDVLESTTGELQDSYNVEQPGPIRGGAAFSYSASSGAVVNWRTGQVRNGRRIRGRSFIVPLCSNAYSTTGQLNPESRTAIQTAAAVLAGPDPDSQLGVYARISASGASDGVWAPCTASSVPALLAVLRSRRD